MKAKMIGLLILLLGGTTITHAQRVGEWFNQKKTQTKYLLKQITALQVYLGYLEKGYAITQEGLHLIGDIKNGEFNLHKDYFNSLKTVNPNIMRYSKVVGILELQIGMLQEYSAALRRAQESGQFSSHELKYIKEVYGNLMEEAGKDMDELSMIISSGQLEMTDDERIKQIDRLYKSMQDKHAFLQSFNDRSMQLAAQRRQRRQEMQQLKGMYGQ